jgi:cytochrome c oxidase subunit II
MPMLIRRFRPLILAAAVAGAALLAGCHEEHQQSVLHPASPPAQRVADLWWFMFWLLTGVFLITMLLLLAAILRGRRRPDRPVAGLGNGFIVISGIILPAIILLALLVVSVQTTINLRMPESDLTIEVIGHQWWWEVRYPDHDIITANEIHIPAGRPVRLRVWSNDVIHSFWVPNLHGKIDMLPEHPNHFWIQSDQPGEFRGQCAEFCGPQHALMAFIVVALPEEQFEKWLEHASRPAPPPHTPGQQRGLEIFFAPPPVACYTCHAIKGTEADATIGPDLTHIASRRTLGAGTIANNHGNLAGWIVNPQVIKPGNRMPRTHLEPDQLHDLLEYLGTLE